SREKALVVRGALVALVEEMRSIVIARIGAVQAVENEVGVLVGLGLGRFDRTALAGQRTRCRDMRTVAAEAVELETLLWTLQAIRTFRDRAFAQLRRQQVRRGDSCQLRIGVRHFGQIRGMRD